MNIHCVLLWQPATEAVAQRTVAQAMEIVSLIAAGVDIVRDVTWRSPRIVQADSTNRAALPSTHKGDHQTLFCSSHILGLEEQAGGAQTQCICCSVNYSPLRPLRKGAKDAQLMSHMP